MNLPSVGGNDRIALAAVDVFLRRRAEAVEVRS
jgi:hypothetical protein